MMSTAVYYAAVGWLAVLFTIQVIHAARDPDTMARLLWIDTASTLLIAVLLLLTLHTAEPYYLDSALVLGLLAFAGTLVAARFLKGGGVLS